MVRNAVVLLAGTVAVLPLACQRSAPPVAPAAPALAVEARAEVEFPSGAKATTWRLRGSGVKRLTAQLAVFADGRARGRTRIECAWDPPSGAVDGQLTLLVEHGPAFGAGGKRLSSLGLAFLAGGPTTRSQTRTDSPPVDDPGGLQSMTAGPAPVDGRAVLYTEVRGPAGPIWQFESDDDLAKASAGGRVALAVILEWAP